MANLVTVANLGNEFDLGDIEAGKIHLKFDGTSIVRDPVTGVVSAAAGSDTYVEDMTWNPATNELTLTMNDSTEHTVSLATLAADKFLSNSSFDPETGVLTLIMTDGSEYTVNLSDLILTQTGYGLIGNGTTGSPVAFDASELALDDSGAVAFASEFVLSTPTDPEGVRVPAEFVTQMVYDQMVDGEMIGVTTGAGLEGDGWSEALVFDARSLPVHSEPQQMYFVMSDDDTAGARMLFATVAGFLWNNVYLSEVQSEIEGAVDLSVTDAFGNHLFYARP